MRPIKYWIAAVSKDHAQLGVKGGFMQVCHGKQTPLKHMQTNDWLIIYSSKQTLNRAEKCQAFTAIGQVEDEHIYQFEMTETFKPFRRNVTFQPCLEVPILPLISQLEFIPNKSKWGFPFRFGFFEINENDFNLILSNMLVNENIA
jgi:predicted RNA-binding protein